MFPECCTQLQDCCNQLSDCCPVLFPYTGYIFLGFLSLLLLILWRCAAARAARTQEALTDVLNAVPVAEPDEDDSSVALSAVVQICSDAMLRQTQSHAEALATIRDIVSDLTVEDDDDDDEEDE